jgi:hypothetical protein
MNLFTNLCAFEARMASLLWHCAAVLVMAVACLGSGEHMVVENARYLRNKHGAQVGHWASAISQLIPHIDRLSAEMQRQGTFRSPRDATVEIHLEDSVRREWQMRSISTLISTNAYVRLTLEAARRAFGITLTFTTAPSDATTRVDAGRAPSDDQWWRSGGERFTEAVLQVAACDLRLATRAPDVLVYNRLGSRSITNPHEVTQLLQASGMTTTVVTVTRALTPAQQICVVSKSYEYIITPHGGQMASLLFKHASTAIVEVSPPKGVLEFYRFMRPTSEPWFALQGRLLWACEGFCADTAREHEDIGAVLLPLGCGVCARAVKGDPITVDLRAVKKIVIDARFTRDRVKRI